MSHLSHVTMTIFTIYVCICSLFPRRLHIKFSFDWISGFSEIMVIYMYIALGQGQTTPFWFWRRFSEVFTICGHCRNLGHVTWTIYTIQLMPLSEGDITICSPEAGNIAREIWLRLAKRFQRCLNDTRGWVYYKLTIRLR